MDHYGLNQIITATEKLVEKLFSQSSNQFCSHNDCIDISIQSVDKIKRYISPIVKKLEKLDAESMLSLKRVSDGALLGKGRIRVKPIHHDIYPRPRQRQNVKRSSFVVRYLHVTESPYRYSVGIFVFPPGAKIPLHDHPGMCVISRVLYGELKVRYYDIIEEDSTLYQKEQDICMNKNDEEEKKEKDSTWSLSSLLSNNMFRTSSPDSDRIKYASNGRKMARRHPVKTITAPNVTSLFPFQGNMHEFTAGKEGAAILDILMPPYDVEEDRDCTYYIDNSLKEIYNSENTISSFSEKEFCWLNPIPQPDDFQCKSGQYLEFGE